MKSYCYVHKHMSVHPVLGQFNPVDSFTYHFLRTMWGYSPTTKYHFTFPTEILYAFLIISTHVVVPLISSSCVDLAILLIWWRIQIMKLFIIQFSPFSFYYLLLMFNCLILFSQLLYQVPSTHSHSYRHYKLDKLALFNIESYTIFQWFF
jgi:hypothetical protein